MNQSNYAQDHKRPPPKERLSLRINGSHAAFVAEHYHKDWDNMSEFYKDAIKQAVTSHPDWKEWKGKS